MIGFEAICNGACLLQIIFIYPTSQIATSWLVTPTMPAQMLSEQWLDIQLLRLIWGPHLASCYSNILSSHQWIQTRRGASIWQRAIPVTIYVTDYLSIFCHCITHLESGLLWYIEDAYHNIPMIDYHDACRNWLNILATKEMYGQVMVW